MLGPSDEPALTSLFDANNQREITDFFDPFPLTASTAHAITHHQGRDLYWGVMWRGKLVGICMVRGWDSGHEHRALGLMISRGVQSGGIGAQAVARALAHLRDSGEVSVRARIHKANQRSRRIVLGLGFEEVVQDGEQIVYECDLRRPMPDGAIS
jgi:RimJ/RimL family protein N-acetyltransferase